MKWFSRSFVFVAALFTFAGLAFFQPAPEASRQSDPERTAASTETENEASAVYDFLAERIAELPEDRQDEARACVQKKLESGLFAELEATLALDDGRIPEPDQIMNCCINPCPPGFKCIHPCVCVVITEE